MNSVFAHAVSLLVTLLIMLFFEDPKVMRICEQVVQ